MKAFDSCRLEADHRYAGYLEASPLDKSNHELLEKKKCRYRISWWQMLFNLTRRRSTLVRRKSE